MEAALQTSTQSLKIPKIKGEASEAPLSVY